MAKQYAGKRAKLKAMAVDDKLTPEERFGARLKLAELPRNSSPTRIRNRCEITAVRGPSIASSSCRALRCVSWRRRALARRREVELVTGARRPWR
jgi:hypothetical protein